MKYADFEKTIDTNSTTTYWIVDYRYKNVSGKPVRHLKPTKVCAYSVKEFPPETKVYYADYYFREVLSDGEMGEVIQPYDATGNWDYKGIGVHVFMIEDEAKEFYTAQSISILIKFEKAKKAATQRFEDMKKLVSSNLRDLA